MGVFACVCRCEFVCECQCICGVVCGDVVCGVVCGGVTVATFLGAPQAPGLVSPHSFWQKSEVALRSSGPSAPGHRSGARRRG